MLSYFFIIAIMLFCSTKGNSVGLIISNEGNQLKRFAESELLGCSKQLFDVFTTITSSQGESAVNRSIRDTTDLPIGERPGEASLEELASKELPKNERYLRLITGKLFRVSSRSLGQEGYSYTSEDNGETWQRGGLTVYCRGIEGRGSMTFESSAIQILNGEFKGRIVLPYYFGMYGEHPDYTREQRGGYALWKGEKIILETHTHVPEMAGTFFMYSDDEGETWHMSEGYLVGYIHDGHMGHLSCEEPAVVELQDGRLMCYIRSTCGRILKSYSSNGGQSWSKVELTDLAMSNSPCMIKRIPGTGDLVLIWNQMSAEEIEAGARRTRLTVAISTDDGVTWIKRKNIEVSSGYPDITHVEPPPFRPMVRGVSGPDHIMSELPDGFIFYHYPEIFFSRDGEEIFFYYSVSPKGDDSSRRWRVFPVEWLYSK